MSSHVINKPFLGSFLLGHELPQPRRLLKVLVRDFRGERNRHPRGCLVECADALILSRARSFLAALLKLQGFDAGPHIVRIVAVVGCKIHEAVALNGAVDLALSGISREELVVDAESVAGGVGVGKHARLEHGVWAGGDAADHVAGAEGCLLDLGEPVGGILVEDHAADFAEGVLLVGPDFGHVEDVGGCVGYFVGVDGLHADVPGWEVLPSDCFLEIHEMLVGLGSTNLCSFDICVVMNSLVC